MTWFCPICGEKSRIKELEAQVIHLEEMFNGANTRLGLMTDKRNALDVVIAELRKKVEKSDWVMTPP